MVGEDIARLQGFCEDVTDYALKIKTIQKKMTRSLRAMNPHNYNPDYYVTKPNGKKTKKRGTVIKGASNWQKSKRYQVMQREIRELQRVMAATRARAHGELANEIISIGKNIKTEKLSYKSFQRNFGKSVG